MDMFLYESVSFLPVFVRWTCVVLYICMNNCCICSHVWMAPGKISFLIELKSFMYTENTINNTYTLLTANNNTSGRITLTMPVSEKNVIIFFKSTSSSQLYLFSFPFFKIHFYILKAQIDASIQDTDSTIGYSERIWHKPSSRLTYRNNSSWPYICA